MCITSTYATCVCVFCGFGLICCRISSNWRFLLFLQETNETITVNFYSFNWFQLQKIFSNTREWLHQKITTKLLQWSFSIHPRLGQGSPITTSLDLGRGGFDLLVLADGRGREDLGLSGIGCFRNDATALSSSCCIKWLKVGSRRSVESSASESYT